MAYYFVREESTLILRSFMCEMNLVREESTLILLGKGTGSDIYAKDSMLPRGIHTHRLMGEVMTTYRESESTLISIVIVIMYDGCDTYDLCVRRHCNKSESTLIITIQRVNVCVSL